MSYTQEQREKNRLYIDSHLADCSPQDRGDVIQQCTTTWADDEQVKIFVANKRKEIAGRATQDEIDLAFKDFKI